MLRAAAVLMFLSACATSHTVTALGEGITVHTFRRDFTNAHVVVRGSDAFMVDSGLERNVGALRADLVAAGIEPTKLRAVVLTHAHADHAGGAGVLQAQLGVPVVVGALDVERLTAGTNDRLCPTDDEARRRLAADQAETFSGFAAQRVVAEPAPLEPLTGIPGSIVPLPGHTPGSLVVVLPQAALVGDLFRGAVLGASAEQHFYICDVEGNRRDVRRLLEEVAPAARTFFTGHFGPLERSAVERRFAER